MTDRFGKAVTYTIPAEELLNTVTDVPSPIRHVRPDQLVAMIILVGIPLVCLTPSPLAYAELTALTCLQKAFIQSGQGFLTYPTTITIILERLTG
jgi:hypothetical protein